LAEGFQRRLKCEKLMQKLTLPLARRAKKQYSIVYQNWLVTEFLVVKIWRGGIVKKGYFIK
jgi:hypothetical protein